VKTRNVPGITARVFFLLPIAIAGDDTLISRNPDVWIDPQTAESQSRRQAMPYAAELSRNTIRPPLIFLIDQSSSMAEAFGAQPEKPKAEGVADQINRLLQKSRAEVCKGDGIRDYFHVGVHWLTAADVAWAPGAGKLAGKSLCR